jgi:outer membrane protein OmpA-like peptidoglycan-associated protein
VQALAACVALALLLAAVAPGLAQTAASGEAAAQRLPAPVAAGSDAQPLSGSAASRAMRRLASQLRAQVKDTPVELATLRGDTLRLRIPAGYLFGLDAVQLRPEASLRLDPLVATLASADRTQLVVVGHADTLGTREFNDAFTRRRADAIAEYLQAHGIAALRVTTRGAGESQPVEEKETSPAARQRNRRIEIEVRPFRPSRREAS